MPLYEITYYETDYRYYLPDFVECETEEEAIESFNKRYPKGVIVKITIYKE